MAGVVALWHCVCLQEALRVLVMGGICKLVSYIRVRVKLGLVKLVRVS